MAETDRSMDKYHGMKLVSGERCSKHKLPYDEQELKEILETAILNVQRVKLNDNKLNK